MTARLHRLANGVRVVADPMAGLESAALSVVVRGGARWEAPERNGWSHLLEHMVFKGAGARTSREIVEAIEGEGGWINAATGYERTSYQVRHLAGGLPLAMEVLADLVRRPVVDPSELEREKGVIGQEIAEAADTPDDRVFDLAQARAFHDQAMGRPILGLDSTLAPATRDALLSHHTALYGDPARLVVSAAGAVDEDELLRLAEAAFGDMAPRPAAPPLAPAAFRGGAEAEARPLEQAHMVLLLPGVAANDADYWPQRLFAEVLGGGMASRLFQEAREARGLCYAVDAYAEAYEDTGLLGIYAGVSDRDAAPMARLAAAELAKLAAQIGEAELARAKAQARSSLHMGRESPLNRAEGAAAQLHMLGRLVPPAEIAARIDAVGPADIARYGARVLGAGASAAAVLGRKRAGTAAPAFAEALAAA
ncbi:MAG: insulinase family protein [Caulobacteraceae bacterium]|nr:insulinase family protein [Caulobacter sp.]